MIKDIFYILYLKLLSLILKYYILFLFLIKVSNIQDFLIIMMQFHILHQLNQILIHYINH
jgi:hypothetical protein